jgi:DNA-binding MarR family transcriptional regulator
MMTDARPLPTVIGPTENALRALLTKILSTTLIKTYPAWVILNAVSNADATTGGGHWRLAVAEALKVELSDVDDVLGQLRAAGLVGRDGLLTTLGATDLATGRSAVSAATARMLDGIGDQDQATARLVLEHVRRKADELLRI